MYFVQCTSTLLAEVTQFTVHCECSIVVVKALFWALYNSVFTLMLHKLPV